MLPSPAVGSSTSDLNVFCKQYGIGGEQGFNCSKHHDNARAIRLGREEARCPSLRILSFRRLTPSLFDSIAPPGLPCQKWDHSWDHRTRSGTLSNAGGARRDRTADLLHAMQALSQLSYGPTRKRAHATQPPKGCQAEPAGGLARAASMRASVRARPSNSSVTSIGGETAVPVTATRTGCAILPSPLCRRAASSASTV